MSDKIKRRSFINRSAAGLGALALGSDLPVHGRKRLSVKQANARLIATTDYYDNLYEYNYFFDRARLDELHKYLASIGVTRHQWIFDTIWDLYNESSEGFDLLSEVVKSAHAHGIELYTIIKLFEGGGFGDTFPNSLPFPSNVNALRDMRGIYPFARPFVAANPHLCLKRRPGTYEVGGPVTTIRLVKADDKPTRIRPGNLTIWTSPTNNNFSQYTGPVTFREAVEWRPAFPASRPCRILHLEALRLPEGHSYILIRCNEVDQNEDFGNERGSLVELITSGGKSLPFILGTGSIQYATHDSKYFHSGGHTRLIPYLHHPEVVSELQDESKGNAHYRDFHFFGEHRPLTRFYSLVKEGYVAIAMGKPEYMLGNLHPIYPEVRRHWLEMVEFCLNRGVDGINFRHSNHTRSPEAWEYGFNEPVIEKAKGKTDYPTIRRINGDSYTQFLREAGALIKSKGKSVTIHLYSQMLLPDDRSGQIGYIPPNFEWQWETWVREIADDLEFRGAWTLRPPNLRQVIETFGAVTHSAGKPFYFQGNMKELMFDGPHHFTAQEMDWVLDHPFLQGFVLYETSLFTRHGAAGQILGSPDIKTLTENRFSR